MMNESSEDIFFEVKKQILDKLDLILQKINIQIINYIKPHEDDFTFIQMSHFQNQITMLFGYLDRLYASLNSSVSFSSIQSYKESAEHYHVQNQRLVFQNQKLRKIVQQLSQSNVTVKGSTSKQQSQQDLLNQMKMSYNSMLDPLKFKIRALTQQYQGMIKSVKKLLKGYKFQMLETRVEIISKLKDWESRRGSQYTQLQKEDDGGNTCCQIEHYRDCEDILDGINEILSIC